MRGSAPGTMKKESASQKIVRKAGRLRRLFRCVRRNEEGAAAVEFALILPVFLLFLLGIMEVSIMFFTTTVVDNAMLDAARLVRTGQAQTAGNAVTTFRNQVCASLGAVYDCNNLNMDVRAFGSFGTMNFVIEEDADGDPVYVFNAGGASDAVLVRVIYDFNFNTPMIGNLMGGADNTVQMTAAAIFRTEPFE